MWTNESVKDFFDNEKILIGSHDVLPAYIARSFFGNEAVDFAKRLNNGEDYNFYGIGGNKQLTYLTYRGVQIAATHSNICEARENMRKYGVKDDFNIDTNTDD